MTDLTIIIVTFNSSKIISKCLSKIYNSNYDIIISDSNSSDNTIAIIKKDFPRVKIIKNSENIGFAKANNIGFKNSNSQFVATLNPDCFFENIADIEKIINIMKSDNKIAIASAMLYSGFLDNDKLSITNQCQIAAKGYFNEQAKYYHTKFISGCFMMLRVSIFEKTGFFNEKFFMYCEDNEICKRTLKNNYKLVIVKDTKICHLSQQSSDSRNNKQFNDVILWYRFGYSKLIYTQEVHNKFIAKLRAIRNIIKNYFIILHAKCTNNNINNINRLILDASICYLLNKEPINVNKK
jgi:GT2 family glycosyltransferase